MDIVSKGGNFLLNVGPDGQGLFPPESVERLAAIGVWTRANGESIYQVKASPYDRPEWGRYTSKPGLLYAHVFDWPEDGKLEVHPEVKIKAASLLTSSSDQLEVEAGSTTILLPKVAPDTIATVIRIELAD